MSFSEDRIELKPGLTIEKLTNNEVKLALRQGVMSPLFGPSSTSFKLGEAHSFALKKAWTTQRRWGGPMDPNIAEQMQRSGDMSAEVERLLQCMAMFTHQPVFVTGILTSQVASDVIFPLIPGISYQLIPTAAHSGGGFHFDGENALISSGSGTSRKMSHPLKIEPSIWHFAASGMLFSAHG